MSIYMYMSLYTDIPGTPSRHRERQEHQRRGRWNADLGSGAPANEQCLFRSDLRSPPFPPAVPTHIRNTLGTHYSFALTYDRPRFRKLPQILKSQCHSTFVCVCVCVCVWSYHRFSKVSALEPLCVCVCGGGGGGFFFLPSAQIKGLLRIGDLSRQSRRRRRRKRRRRRRRRIISMTDLQKCFT